MSAAEVILLLSSSDKDGRAPISRLSSLELRQESSSIVFNDYNIAIGSRHFRFKASFDKKMVSIFRVILTKLVLQLVPIISKWFAQVLYIFSMNNLGSGLAVFKLNVLVQLF